MLFDLFQIIKCSVDKYARRIVALDGRHPSPRACRQNQLIIRKRFAGQIRNGFVFTVDLRDEMFGQKFNSVFVVPITCSQQQIIDRFPLEVL